MTFEDRKTVDPLALDARHPLRLDDAGTFYLVTKGRVLLFFAELDDKGVNRRKHFVDAYVTGQRFSGALLKAEGKRYALFASGEFGSFVVAAPQESPEAVQETLDLMEVLRARADEQVEQEAENSRQRVKRNEASARRSLLSTLDIFRTGRQNVPPAEESVVDPTYDACRILCRHLGVNLAGYAEIASSLGVSPTVEDIARISKFAVRDVLLEENWWKADNGPLLLQAIEDDRPLVCIPTSPSKYRVHDVVNGTSRVLTAEAAKGIIPRGTMFYRPFPNKKLTYKDLFLFGLKASWKRDIAKLFLGTLISSLIGLLLPELNQKIFDNYIPEGASDQLVQMGLLVLAFMVGNFLVSLTQAFCTFRASNMMEYAIQAATFDRLFNLPGKFYGKYTSGELASRAMGITSIFNTLADTAVSTILSSVFSLLYLWRMFHFSSKLSFLGLVMVTISVVITISVSKLQMRFQRKLIEISNRQAGFLYQLILGIAKLRISGSEERAVYKWNVDFLATRKLVIQKERMSNWINAVNNMLPTLFTIAIYYMLIVKKIDIAFGAYMAYNAAFGSFSGSVMNLAHMFLQINNLGPIYDKAKPVLETTPEYEEHMALVEDLTGAIEVSHAEFRYTPDGPPILKDLTFSIKSGEYVGIVGPSGGGKSTLLKVLLGFEKLDAGKIFYDDKDLDELDKRELRKKLGVVLQDGQLIAGSIYDNITITNSRIGMKNVRDVIMEAGLEADIAKMPMGLYTNLMEDATTISGGQKQRILIARAIVNRPRILFFDEATSSLDNVTQAIVGESLAKLNATRVVIAHRLSTVVNCDRILVISNGEIVEQGTYAELMANQALFFELASRQIA